MKSVLLVLALSSGCAAASANLDSTLPKIGNGLLEASVAVEHVDGAIEGLCVVSSDATVTEQVKKFCELVGPYRVKVKDGLNQVIDGYTAINEIAKAAQ